MPDSALGDSPLAAAPNGFDTVGHVMERFRDAVEANAAPWLDVPGLGATREFDARLRNAMSAWLDVSSARADFDAVIADAWRNTFEALTRDLPARCPEGLAAAHPREILSSAIGVADQVFGETFRSSRYVEAQRRLFDAAAGYRFREGELIDDIASAGHFATRREVDEAYRRIDELRREIRALRKARSGKRQR